MLHQRENLLIYSLSDLILEDFQPQILFFCISSFKSLIEFERKKKLRRKNFIADELCFVFVGLNHSLTQIFQLELPSYENRLKKGNIIYWGERQRERALRKEIRQSRFSWHRFLVILRLNEFLSHPMTDF